MRKQYRAVAGLVLGLSVVARAGAEAPGFKPPRGLEDEELVVPADNPITAGKIELGKQLFFDKRLSKTKAMSCESCHVPEKGWTDALPLSPKFDGTVNVRHTPTLYGTAFYPDLYWDGRAKGLEAQILAAWKAQMGADPDQIAKDVEAIAAYKDAFEKELGGPPTGDRIVKALATFVRTIHAGDTPWDKMDPKKRDASKAGRGFVVFSKLAQCTLCHLPPLYSDTLFHNVGVGSNPEKPDLGRGKFLADAAAKAGQPVPAEAETLQGAFKTPSLRGAVFSGPYFHDGSVATLEAAVDFMIAGGTPNPHLDPKLKPARLSAKQRADLIEFLKSLTPAHAPYARPSLP